MKMFLLDLRTPTRKIVYAEVAVKVCPQTVWVIYKGRRYLLGSSAFQSLSKAAMVQREIIKRIAPLRYGKTWDLANMARKWLDTNSAVVSMETHVSVR